MLIHPMPDPIAIALGPLAIRWYGLMYLLAFGLFILLGRLRVRQPHQAAAGWRNLDVEDMLFYGVLGVVVGGRLGEVLFYHPQYYLKKLRPSGCDCCFQYKQTRFGVGSWGYFRG